MSKKEGKLTIIEKLIVISTFMAATVIIYTACWYVEISEVKEVAYTEKEPLHLCNKDEDMKFCYSRFVSVTENPKYDLNEYRYTEPIKIVITNDKSETYQICYYSTELKAQTAYQCYQNKYPSSIIDGNVITFLCK